MSEVLLAHFSDGGVIESYSLIARDISDRVRLEQDLLSQACHDTLTGLLNRRGFLDALATALETAAARGEPLAVLFLDLNGFKAVNDTGGHGAGDGLLASLAGLLGSVVRGRDVIGRLGGDEFAVFMPGATPEDARGAALRLSALISKHRFVADGRGFAVTTSIGISVFPADGESAEGLLVNADAAMYRAKQSRSVLAFHGQAVDGARLPAAGRANRPSTAS